MVLHDPLEGGHARPDEHVDLLRIQGGGQRGEPRQVREQERDQLPLAARAGVHVRLSGSVPSQPARWIRFM